MVVSVVPFLIVQIPQIMSSTSGRHFAVLFALVVYLALLVAYCLYQVFQLWVQKRRLEYLRLRHVIIGFLRNIKRCSLGKLLTADGEINEEVMKKFFLTIDEDKDGSLFAAELKALLVEMNVDKIDFDGDDAVNKIMTNFNTSNNPKLELGEFVNGIKRWLARATCSRDGSAATDFGTMRLLDDAHHQTKQELARIAAGGQSDEAAEGVDNPKWVSLKAMLLLILGTVIAALFADPLVDAVDNFSTAASIPTFFTSFIALPLATNSSEAVSDILRVVWGGDHEQHALPVSLLGPCLCEGTDMGLHIGGPFVRFGA